MKHPKSQNDSLPKVMVIVVDIIDKTQLNVWIKVVVINVEEVVLIHFNKAHCLLIIFIFEPNK
jgi:predicted Ser/Thr protein kinase